MSDRLKDFKFLLRRRGLNVNKLAAEIGAGRCHLSQVLHGARTGDRTKVLLYRVLTVPEIVCVGWWDEYHAWTQLAAEKKNGAARRKDLQPAAAGVPIG